MLWSLCLLWMTPSILYGISLCVHQALHNVRLLKCMNVANLTYLILLTCVAGGVSIFVKAKFTYPAAVILVGFEAQLVVAILATVYKVYLKGISICFVYIILLLFSSVMKLCILNSFICSY